MKVLAIEIACPGKTVVATFQGRVVETYRCREEDAAVVWLAFVDEIGNLCETSVLHTATDQDGRTYDSRGDQRSQVYLLRIERGYAKKPPYITANVKFGEPVPRNESHVKITNLPEPARFVPDVPAQPTPVAVAEHFADEEVLSVRSAAPSTVKEILVPEVLQATYSPTDMRSAYYWKTATSARVRLTTYRLTHSIQKLVYHGARTSLINGIRTLLLPEKQQIGSIHGIPIFASKFATTSNARSGQEASTIHLFAGSPSKGIGADPNFDSTSTVAFRLRLMALIPPARDLGFRAVRVRLEGNNYVVGFDRSLPSIALPGESPPATIPTLEFQVEVSAYEFSSRKTLILPIHQLPKRGDRSSNTGPLPNHIEMSPSRFGVKEQA